VLLRLAVVLNRARSDETSPEVRATADGDRLRLAFPQGWLDAHPLTRVDLEQEADYLRAAGIELEIA
jgi:exopolyphosphatase/guanosine-5'-triphosphate,3'-diphosphate pyrophosphatase